MTVVVVNTDGPIAGADTVNNETTGSSVNVSQARITGNLSAVRFYRCKGKPDRGNADPNARPPETQPAVPSRVQGQSDAAREHGPAKRSCQCTPGPSCPDRNELCKTRATDAAAMYLMKPRYRSCEDEHACADREYSGAEQINLKRWHLCSVLLV